MLYIKENPRGVDTAINMLQSKLYTKLGISNINGFGRVYPVENSGKTVPAHFYKGEDYLETLLDDAVDCQFFFVEDGETEVVNSLNFTPVSIIFLLNLKNLKPEIKHRADEECKIEIQQVLSRMKIFSLDRIVKGVDALEGFDFEMAPMQPFEYLRFSGVISYQFNC